MTSFYRILFLLTLGIALNASPFSSKIVESINAMQEVPGLQREEFSSLKKEILQTWETLMKEGAVEISGTDKEVRPSFVALQGIVEHVLAAELGKEVKQLKGYIHTPMPATPLCSKGEISRELVDPSIELDAGRLFTVKARTTIVRDYLFKGGNLYVVYPKEGIKMRTEEQQMIYRDELKKHPLHLVDIPLDCDAIPSQLIGATYFFQDKSGNKFAFAIKMTQAKDPKEIGHFGLWFGPVETPSVKGRIKEVFSFLNAHNPQNNIPLNML